MAASAPPEPAFGQHAFDLNIDKVLEHWTVPFALRELIANALDEQALTGTAHPETRDDAAGAWHIRDFGQGLRYQHLSQNESNEKKAVGGRHCTVRRRSD